MNFYPYNEWLSDILQGFPCVLAYDTASDYLGMSKGCDSTEISVFVTAYNQQITERGIENSVKIHQFVISSFRQIETENRGNISCTTPEQTIINLLEQDGDNQVIQEALASYYFRHNESFEGLRIPANLSALFDKYSDWAISYYDE